MFIIVSERGEEFTLKLLYHVPVVLQVGKHPFATDDSGGSTTNCQEGENSVLQQQT